MTTPEHDENDNRVSVTVDCALLTRAMQLAPDVPDCSVTDCALSRWIVEEEQKEGKKSRVNSFIEYIRKDMKRRGVY